MEGHGEFSPEEIQDVVGEGRTLSDAYEDFAKRIAERVADNRGLAPGDLPEDFFDRHPIPTVVKVVVQPHNEWVKAYWVKAY